MTPQYIMRKSLCRPAHCYSAWIKGEGYVLDERRIIGTPEQRAELQAEYDRQRRRTADSEIDNLGWADGYAEPGYQNEQPKRGVLFANWNVFPRGLDTILERAGYAVEWSDEWSTCDDCNKAVRTQPNGYDWKPEYDVKAIERGEMICTGCADEDASDEDEDEVSDNG